MSSRLRFRWRVFTSQTLFIGALVITVSGVIIYLAPHHHLADLMEWKVLGLTRQQWWDLHLTSMIVFMVPFVFHLFRFNWKAFLHYLGRTKRGTIRHPGETIATLLLTAVLIWGTLAGWPVTNWVIGLQEDIRIAWSQSWQRQKPEPSEQVPAVTVPDSLAASEETSITP